jgi:serine/threonine protein kinase
MVVKSYESEFVVYDGPPISKEEFLSLFDREIVAFVDDMCTMMGKLGMPRFLDPCMRKIQRDKSGTTVIAQRGQTLPPPQPFSQADLICDSQYHEFLLGSIVNSIIDKKLTIHLPRTYNIVACPKSTATFMYYILIELLHDAISVDYVPGAIREHNPLSDLLVQVYHTLYLLHSLFKISHNDLHSDNILLVPLSNVDVASNGERMDAYEYWEYQCAGKSLYVTRTDHLAKIIDFGLACKFGGQVVCSYKIATDTYHVIPPQFNSAQDILMVADALSSSYTEGGSVRRRIYSYMYRKEMSDRMIAELHTSEKQLYGRVAPDKLPENPPTVADLLRECDLFDHHRELPPGAQALLVGHDV